MLLDLFVRTAYAQDAPAPPTPGGQGFELVFFFGTIFAIWWFLVLRPQAKQAREHQSLVNSLKKGDQVVTASGIHGKVASVEERTVQLEVAKGVRIKLDRDKVLRGSQPEKATDAAASKTE